MGEGVGLAAASGSPVGARAMSRSPAGGPDHAVGPPANELVTAHTKARPARGTALAPGAAGRASAVAGAKSVPNASLPVPWVHGRTRSRSASGRGCLRTVSAPDSKLTVTVPSRSVR